MAQDYQDPVKALFCPTIFVIVSPTIFRFIAYFFIYINFTITS